MDTNTLENLPLYTVVMGYAGIESKLRDDQWDMFTVDDFCASREVLDTAKSYGVDVARDERGDLVTPMVDDEATQGMDVDDLDACLAYLAQGGSLIKLPDSSPTTVWRWYPVLRCSRGIHARLSSALGWSMQDVQSMSLLTLRDIVRPVSPKLAHEVNCMIGGVL